MILEVVDNRGRVQHRTRLPNHRVTIGRGYDNDVIVDDPYVDARHLEIAVDPDGGLRYSDRGSRNGTWIHRGEKQTGGTVIHGLELRIGHTVIRFVDATHAVMPARPDAGRAVGVRHLVSRPTTALRVVMVAVLVRVLLTWLTSATPSDLSALATPALLELLGATIWAGGWAIATRLATHQYRFLSHLAWFAIVGLASVALDLGLEWLGFLWPASRGPEGMALGGQFALIVFLLAGHLAITADWTPRRRWRIASLVTTTGYLVMIALGGTAGLGPDETTRYARTLKPLSPRLIPADDLDGFFRKAGSLEADVAELVDEGDR